MDKITLMCPLIVEGKYDKIRLASIIASPIIALGGFGVFNDTEKQKLLRLLGKNGLIILTDSDRAGGFIRAKLKGYLAGIKLYNVYTPQIEGKEPRKRTASKDALLGVEGMDTSLLIKLLEPYTAQKADDTVPVTKAMLYEYGYSGKDESVKKRNELASKLGLPADMTAKAFTEALNLLGGAQLLKRKTVSFCTLGCRVNQYESRAMAEEFVKNGYEVLPFGEKCDIAVVNTCAVTAESGRKSAQMIRRAAKLAGKTAAAGCYTSLNCKAEDADIVIGNSGKSLICKILDGAENTASENIFEEMPIATVNAPLPDVSRCRAYVKIQDGCNGKCTYCVIPRLRGRSRTRSTESVMAEIRRLAASGCKEIILTGIETAAYGVSSLCELIKQTDGVEGIERIRIGSLDPNVLTNAFIDTIKNSAHFMPHIHLSVQSASDRILALMKRPYTKEKLEARINALRAAMPDIMISVDIITSFPTETEAEFRETLEFTEKYSILHVHAFSFSPRPMTEAYEMSGIIDSETAKRRARELITLSERVKNKLLSLKIGISVYVLVESEKDGFILGHTEDFCEARIKTNIPLFQGDIVNVLVNSVNNEMLECELNQ